MKLGLFFLFCFLTFSVLADSYQITHQRGRVEVIRAGKVVTGEVLSGDIIKVYKGGMLIIKNAKETLKIFQDTVLTPYEEKGTTIIKLAKGALISMVQKKKFKIKTKNFVLGVRGTQFFVQVTGESDAWMCVQEGVVNVNTKGVKSSVDVPAGKGVFIGPQEISPPKAYAWTKGINWKMDPGQGKLEHNLKLNYDLLNKFYD